MNEAEQEQKPAKQEEDKGEQDQGSLGKLHCFWISSYQRSLCLSQQQPSPAQPQQPQPAHK